MKILVLGSVALDSVETPKGKIDRALGGSASYFAYAASFFSGVSLCSVVGEDFPPRYRNIFMKRKIDLDGLTRLTGKTFHWEGFYGKNLNEAQTRNTCLNVLEHFTPEIPASYRSIPAVFLANFDPDLQAKLLDQMHCPKLIACDTMNLWITRKRPSLTRLLHRVHIFLLNETEARMLTGCDNLIRAAKKIRRMGPQHVVIKKGEHGSLLCSGSDFFFAPPFPLEDVADPTGAGDSFAGGFFGYLAAHDTGPLKNHLRKAVLTGSAVASFTVEAFSLDRLRSISRKDITARTRYLETMLRA